VTLTDRDLERFLSKLIPTEDGCWEWSGGHYQITGYTIFNLKMADGVWRPGYGHRASWELLVGPIPDGLVMDHLCRNRGCVNPDHLEPVTQRVNNLRGESRSARQATWTHCPQGHPFDEGNTYRRPSGKRECRECTRERDRQRYRRVGNRRKRVAA